MKTGAFSGKKNWQSFTAENLGVSQNVFFLGGGRGNVMIAVDFGPAVCSSQSSVVARTCRHISHIRGKPQPFLLALRNDLIEIWTL